ncbi:SigB/SigF/SigG family RNA polymerase sigma factor [Marmoricola endophyticus]|nr:SigB/SigF/SigG family RNA polymerase sigma factor [Marmoricola endophyticus]
MAGAPHPPDRDHVRSLFATLASATASSAQTTGSREELVHLHLDLVTLCARRFGGRGESLDDLVQVGTIGLLNAIDRFDAERGFEFATFATPTIVGEIKRHFRDKSWAVRVPRRLQELRAEVNAATGDLTQDLGRSPTPREVAIHLGLGLNEVVEALESSNAYSTLSLDHRGHGDDEDEGSSVLDLLGAEDEALEGVELRESLWPLVDSLPARQRDIVRMRFVESLSQQQIADRVGLSQMQISRLLRRALETLRGSFDT